MKTWTITMADSDRTWLRGLLYGVARGWPLGKGDRDRARAIEAQLAPRVLRGAQPSSTDGGTK